MDSTSPAADELIDQVPDEVRIEFDEPVDARLAEGIRVYDPNGRRVDRSVRDGGSASSTVVVGIDGAGTGTYTVAWRVVSGDSHVLSGSYVFHVQRETGGVVAVDAESVSMPLMSWMARWGIVAAMSLLGGLAVFVLVVGEPGGLRDRGSRSVLIVLGAVGLVAAGVRFAAQVASASGRPLLQSSSLWWEALAGTRVGQVDGLRIGGAAVVVVGAATWVRRTGPSLVVLGSVAIAIANAMGGHAWTTSVRIPAVALSVLHQSAISVWVGALVGLALGLRAGLSGALPLRLDRLLAGTLTLTAITGVASGALQIGSVDRVWATPYGRVLSAKVALVVVMVTLARKNHVSVGTVGLRAVLFARRLGGEIGLAVAVLAMTALLVGVVADSAGGCSYGCQGVI